MIRFPKLLSLLPLAFITAVCSFAQSPTLTSITPSSGGVGTLIAIAGQGIEPGGCIAVNGTCIAAASWTSTQVAATIPPGVIPPLATSVSVDVRYSSCDDYGCDESHSNTLTLLVAQSAVTAMSPTSGYLNTGVTLTGSNFGATQGTSSVTYNGMTVSPSSWSNSQIVVPVPVAASGTFRVDVAGLGAGVSPTFTIQPYISSINPSSGGVGTQITISGSALAVASDEQEVVVNGYSANVSSWTPTQIVATIPSWSIPTAASSVPIFLRYVVEGEYHNYEVARSNDYTFAVAQSAVTAMSPTSGCQGASVTLTGTAFGATQGSTTLKYNGVTAVPTSWSDTQIVVPLPVAASGTFQVNVPGMGIGISPFFEVKPCISSISPSTAGVGSEITINGQLLLQDYFQERWLVIGTAYVYPSIWTDTQIVATIPSGALPSNATSVGVYATYSDDYSELVNTNALMLQTPHPLINSFSPTYGIPGTQVTLNGDGFGAVQGNSKVQLSGVDATVVSWSDTKIVAIIPNAPSGPLAVLVPGQFPVERYSFGIPPYIASISPAVVQAGAEIHITGQSLNQSGYDTRTLVIGSASVVSTSWTDTEIVATVPAAAIPSGATSIPISTNYLWTYDEGYWDYAESNTFNLSIMSAPTLVSVSPLQGYPRTIVTITGSHFGALDGTTTVKFNGATASITSWTDNQIVAVVPNGATTGPVTLSFAGQTLQTESFVVLVSPTIESISPNIGEIGTTVTVQGVGFGASQGSSKVSMTGVEGVATSWSDTQIVLRIPVGSTTGPISVQVGNQTVSGPIFTVRSSSVLKLRRKKSPWTTNLSDAAILDWEVWRPAESGGNVRKVGANLLGSLQPIHGTELQVDEYGFLRFSWADGDVTRTATNVSPELWFQNQAPLTDNAGVTLTAPADTTVKTLKLYVGCLKSCRISSSLSDSNSSASTLQTESFASEVDNVYMVDFAASSAGQTLTVTITNTDVDGYTSVMAAALEVHRPEVEIVSPTNEQQLQSGTDILVSALASQLGSVQVADVAFNVDGAEIVDFNSEPFSGMWSNSPAGHHLLQAAATDENRLIGTSDPVEFDTISDGGILAIDPMNTLPETVNLTTEGTADWIAYAGDRVGQDLSPVPERKAGVEALIQPPSVVSNHGWYPEMWWESPAIQMQDGTPIATSEDARQNFNPVMLLTSGTSNGFEIKVAAGTLQRTLRLYASASNLKGKVRAFLSDGSTAVQEVPFDVAGPSRMFGYAITFKAARENQTLVIRIAVDEDYGWGSLRIGAITLDGAPPRTFPQLTAVRPLRAQPGDPVTLYGVGFGNNQGSNTVLFDGEIGQVLSWTDRQIDVVMPNKPCGASISVNLQGTVLGPLPIAPSTPWTIQPASSVLQVGGSLTLSARSGVCGTIETATWWEIPTSEPSPIDGLTRQPQYLSSPTISGVAPGLVYVYAQFEGEQQSAQIAVVPAFAKPHISKVQPGGGWFGSEILIDGEEFGASQDNASVSFNGVVAEVESWSATEIRVKVPVGATSGPLTVAVAGVVSNAVNFIVRGDRSTQPTVILAPNKLSMIVGDSRTLQAFDSSGAALSGLQWYVDDPSIVSLSTDDPPVLTAVAVGKTTVSAGIGSADITVYPGPALPEGTVKWSIPEDGTGVSAMTAAVPSATGVADVFTTSSSGTVQAITANGTVAWTTKAKGKVIPDFQGGFVDVSSEGVQKHDGVSGLALPAYTFGRNQFTNNLPAVDLEGTVFAIDGTNVVGIDASTGQPKFTHPVNLGTTTTNISCSVQVPLTVSTPTAPSLSTGSFMQGTPLIAGDGYYYLLYRRRSESYSAQCTQQRDQVRGVTTAEAVDTEMYIADEMHVLRISSTGESNDLSLRSTTTDTRTHYAYSNLVKSYDGNGNPIYGAWTKHWDNQHSDSGDFDVVFDHGIITNSDQGVAFGLWEASGSNSSYTRDQDYLGHDSSNNVSSPCCSETLSLATVAGGQNVKTVPLQLSQNPSSGAGALSMYLQQQDGSLIANYLGPTWSENNLIALDLDGNLMWRKSVPEGFTPQAALADGGVTYITAPSSSTHDLVVVDKLGNEIKRTANFTAAAVSWLGNEYHKGSTFSIVSTFARLAASRWSLLGGNASENGTSTVRYESPMSGLRTIAASEDLRTLPSCSAFLDNLVTIANSNHRDPANIPITKAQLITEIQGTALSTASQYVYDGPKADKTVMDQCTEPNCVAKFPAWIMGGKLPDGYTVSNFFRDNDSGTGSYASGLSQYDGYAIWLRLFTDWDGSFKGLTSQFIDTPSGEVNSYGLGTLFHEILHKRSVGGGFTHPEMSSALGLTSCDGTNHNACSDLIGQKCFP